MESRMDKYYREDNTNMQRSSKNAKLYREVYHDYSNLENLPIPDNTNEIDIPELRKLMQQEKAESHKTREDKHIEESKVPEKNNSNKIHDINKLLEYAKNENNKLKDNNHENTSNYRLLETLENKTLTKSDIEHSIHPIPNKKENITEDEEEELSQTRELKYQTKKISDNPVIEQIIPEDSKDIFNTASLSLDILSDLKPTGNTGVTEPIKDPMFEKMYTDETEDNNKEINIPKEEIELNDDSEKDTDIDIIKDDINIEPEEEEKDSSFYTDIYKFTNKDFDEDEEEESNGGFILKIILLIIFIAICGYAIFYFITNYGLN